MCPYYRNEEKGHNLSQHLGKVSTNPDHVCTLKPHSPQQGGAPETPEHWAAPPHRVLWLALVLGLAAHQNHSKSFKNMLDLVFLKGSKSQTLMCITIT